MKLLALSGTEAYRVEVPLFFSALSPACVLCSLVLC